MSVWGRFDDLEGVTKDAVEEARASFEQVPAGKYTVKLGRYTDEFGQDHVVEAGESRSGLPMLKARMRVQGGKYDNNLIFYNQVLVNPNNARFTSMNIANAVSFISGVLGEKVEFESLGQFENLVTQINEGVKFDIDLKYKNDYPEIKVIEPMEIEEENLASEDIPF